MKKLKFFAALTLAFALLISLSQVTNAAQGSCQWIEPGPGVVGGCQKVCPGDEIVISTQVHRCNGLGKSFCKGLIECKKEGTTSPAETKTGIDTGTDSSGSGDGVDIGSTFGSPFGQEGGKTLGDFVSLVVQLAFAISGLLILFLFAFAGFSIIMGAGQNNPQQAEKGRNAATAAVLGFIVVFVAYWIVRLIEEIIGIQFITNFAPV